MVFDQKQHDPCAPPSLFTRSHPELLVLFPKVKKVLKGERFADVEEVKQKMAEALKGITIEKFRTVLCRENVSIGASCPMEGL